MAGESAAPVPDEQLWTIAQVAAYLQKGRNAVYNMALRKEIPCLRLGSSWRFVPADVRAWVEALKRPGATVLPIGRR